jgi:hypothetical protein
VVDVAPGAVEIGLFWADVLVAAEPSDVEFDELSVPGVVSELRRPAPDELQAAMRRPAAATAATSRTGGLVVNFGLLSRRIWSPWLENFVTVTQARLVFNGNEMNARQIAIAIAVAGRRPSLTVTQPARSLPRGGAW